MTPEKKKKQKTLKSTDPSTFQKGMSSCWINMGSMCSWKDDMQIPDVLPNSWDFRRLWCTLWHWGSSSAISDWNLPRRPRYRVGLPSFWSLQNPLTLRIRWLDLIMWRQWHLPQNVGAKRSLPLQHLSCQSRWVMAVIKGHCENGRKIRPGNGTHPRFWSAGVEATNQNNNVNMQVAI